VSGACIIAFSHYSLSLLSDPVLSGVFRNWTRGWTYKRGLRNGSPPAGSRGRAPVGSCGRALEAERFLAFKLNLVHFTNRIN